MHQWSPFRQFISDNGLEDELALSPAGKRDRRQRWSMDIQSSEEVEQDVWARRDDAEALLTNNPPALAAQAALPSSGEPAQEQSRRRARRDMLRRRYGPLLPTPFPTPATHTHSGPTRCNSC